MTPTIFASIRDDVPIRGNSPYEEDTIVRRLSENEMITVIGSYVNSRGNLWYLLAESEVGKWVWSENVRRVDGETISGFIVPVIRQTTRASRIYRHLHRAGLGQCAE